MKILAKYIFILSTFVFTISSSAEQLNKRSYSIEKQRLETINQYLNALKNKDIKTMNSLFSSNGVVISTSKGKIEASQFFSGFLTELKSASIKPFNIYKDINDDDHYAAKFYFSWTEKMGETAGGNYMDDFTFAKNSNKLLQVYMFENKS